MPPACFAVAILYGRWPEFCIFIHYLDDIIQAFENKVAKYAGRTRDQAKGNGGLGLRL